MNNKEALVQIVNKTIYDSNEIANRDITCKITLAHNYREIGFWDTNTQSPLPQINIDFFEGNKIQKCYESLLNTSERFNKLELHFSKDMTPDAKFSWDQAYYDADVEGNKKLKKKK